MPQQVQTQDVHFLPLRKALPLKRLSKSVVCTHMESASNVSNATAKAVKDYRAPIAIDLDYLQLKKHNTKRAIIVLTRIEHLLRYNSIHSN